MKILLTGAGGMVGRNIVAHTKFAERKFLIPPKNELDLLKKTQVTAYLQDNKPDFIIHAAGIVGGINANINNPVRFLVENMQMGINLLTAARDNNIKNLLNLGSSCMYPRDHNTKLTENMVLTGELEPTNEGYALAKIACAKLCEYINREDPSFQYKTVIPCNLYGKYDKFDEQNSHMIPAVIRKIVAAIKENKNQVEIWGDGEARREFMYAGDLADFIFYAIDNFSKMPFNVNVGLGHDYTITEYYKVIANILGYKGTFIYNKSKPTGMRRKLIDNTLLSKFGWSNKTDLESGIRQTCEYFLNENIND
ncbi:NAD-dependent epimerase/dehydratase family protein [Arsenophonus apicola]|uniref:GDP-L-fucose synthase n=1 Tax=Arsenophonus apicola TaxID=2879119 RepID=A0ABY8P3N7_9GAMM|nr:NAD-dependent epimerase/dehydratase family protein [Arsenophonus apicola]WGO83646.1 NAD-dependent epimerase/dehydratase family protein [Arsenophonus apicola]